MNDRTDSPLVCRAGTTTALSLANSPTQAPRLYEMPEFVESITHVKQACAEANRDLGDLQPSISKPIIAAARAILDGSFHGEFALPVIAAGGGTASNMNANEAIAAIATVHYSSGTVVHPNDHVNMAQSSNDVYPTALKLALHPIADDTAAELDRLAGTFDRKAEQYSTSSRLGRTVWQDAVVVPIRDTHRGQATAMRRLASGIRGAAQKLLSVQLGGTVLGTRAGSSTTFSSLALDHLRTGTGFDVRPSDDLIDAFAHSDVFSELADAVARAGAILHKISQDLRILSSGPRAGLGEIVLPRIQPGSSIMPGKNNPVVPNMVTQTSFGIRSAAYAVSMIVAAGEPDINVNGPAIAANLYPALHSLRESTALLNDSCVSGMEWDLDRLEDYKSGSYETLMELAKTTGYDLAAKQAVDGGAHASA